VSRLGPRDTCSSNTTSFNDVVLLQIGTA
jgi:hypothetical protein